MVLYSIERICVKMILFSCNIRKKCGILLALEGLFPLIIMAFMSCIFEYIFYALGLVNNWWLKDFSYVWSQLPWHMFVIGCCILLNKLGYWLSVVLTQVYGLYLLSIIFLCFSLGNSWTEFWIFLIRETTVFEILDFLVCYWMYVLILLVPYSIIMYFICRYQIAQYCTYKNACRKVCVFFGALCVTPLLLWNISTIIRYKTLLNISSPRIILAMRNVINGNIGLPFINLESKISQLKCSDNKVFGVLLIGESATRSHFSCYGYERDTSPNIYKKNCILFDNVFASESYTQGALSYMLSSYSCGDNDPSLKPLLLTTVFESLGSQSRVAYYSSQHLWSNDSVMYQLIRGASYAKNGIKNGDMSLINNLEYELSLNDYKKHLVMLQGMGSHFPFSKRSRKEIKNKFYSNNKYSQKVSDYDASIYETDMLIGKIIEKIDACEHAAWLLYVSDHGETIASKIQRDPNSSETWEIPFVLYFNNKFEKSYPEIVNSIRKAKHKKFQNDIVFNIVFSLLGIEWNGSDNSKVPWCSSFVERPLVFPNVHNASSANYVESENQ